MEVLQNTIKELGTKIDQLSETAKTMKEEQERIKNLMISRDMKQKGTEEEVSFVENWCQKNNLLIFGTSAYPYESYFGTLKITEDFFRMNMRVDVMNWHSDSAIIE
jgi:NAD-specific glutamate dehydrogenase